MYEFKKYRKGILDKSISKCTRIGAIYREGKVVIYFGWPVGCVCVVSLESLKWERK